MAFRNRLNRLNGWQRLWVFVATLYFVGSGIYVAYVIPTSSPVYEKWLEETIGLTTLTRAYYEDKYDDLGYKELINKIQRDYRETRWGAVVKVDQDAVGRRPTPQYKVGEEVTYEGKRHRVTGITPEGNLELEEVQTESVDLVDKKFSVKDFAALVRSKTGLFQEMTDEALVEQYLERFPAYRSVVELSQEAKHSNFVTKALYEIRVAKINKHYEAELRRLPWTQARVIGTGLLLWLIPSVALYVLGSTIGWIYRGFRSPPKSH